MLCLKRDFKTDAYKLSKLKDGASYFEDDLNEMVTCPNCGKRLRYAKTYCSQRYYTMSGLFGYAVCGRCHDEELQEMLETKE